MARRTLLLLCGGLFISIVRSQTCNEAKLAAYAADFPAGTPQRWMYENVAPGAECLSSISVELSDGMSHCGLISISKNLVSSKDHGNKLINKKIFFPRITGSCVN